MLAGEAEKSSLINCSASADIHEDAAAFRAGKHFPVKQVNRFGCFRKAESNSIHFRKNLFQIAGLIYGFRKFRNFMNRSADAIALSSECMHAFQKLRTN